MSDLSGIISQYGFEYQKKVFLHFLVFEMRYGVKLSYELLDDVDFESDDEAKGLGGTKINSVLVQCKTGYVSYATFKHVVCNWILSEPTDKYVLYLDNPLSFEFNPKDISDDIISDALSYMSKPKKRSDCFLHRIYNTFNGFATASDKSVFYSSIDSIVSKLDFEVGGIDALDEETRNRFIEIHCGDVSIQYAKDSRFKAFADFIKEEIAESICKKEPYSIDHNHYGKLCNIAIQNITDKHYNFDYARFKKNKKDILENMLRTREAIFLKKMDISDRVIAHYLINELYYKDLREHYIGIELDDTIDVLEEGAVINYEEEKRKNSNSAVGTFNNTIVRSINDEILSNSQYTQGCYIYLSSDDAKNEYFIDWCGENAKS